MSSYNQYVPVGVAGLHEAIKTGRQRSGWSLPALSETEKYKPRREASTSLGGRLGPATKGGKGWLTGRGGRQRGARPADQALVGRCFAS